MLEKYFDTGGYGSGWDERQTLLHGPTMDKIASDNYTPDALMRVADTLKPRDDGVYVLLNALGADEHWGFNRNGDAFPEWSLKGEPAPADVVASLAERLPERQLKWSQPPTNAYGTKTFEDHAHVYPFHQNKDPKKRIGDVIAAAYNDRMKRTELIVFIMRDKDPVTVRQIEEGEPVPFSMGAKLPFDVCAVCKNIARNRSQYCEHLKAMLRRVLPNGDRCVALNYFPRFFDISRVRKPADQSAWALRKVASAGYGEKVAEMIKREPVQSTEKVRPTLSDPKVKEFIEERLNDDLGRHKALTKNALYHLKEAGIQKAAAHCAALGIYLHDDEVRAIMGPEKLIKTASANYDHFDRDLLEVLTPFLTERSMFEPHFSKRAAKAKPPTAPESAKRGRPDDVNLFAELFDTPTINKLASSVDNNMTIRFAFEPEVFTRVFTPANSNPKWLPFMLATQHR